MTPEGKIKHAIGAILKRYQDDHIWVYMPVPTGYGMSALDYLGVIYGLPFAVEAKAPKGKPTARQQLTIDALMRAGAKVFVINSTETLMELDQWLTTVVKSFRVRS